MKKIWITSLLIMLNISAKAQNLVPNFGFEIQDSCPDGQDEIERCNGWLKFSTAASTPDYYNSCAPMGYFNVPHSGAGYQEDHRNCSAFAGLVTFSGSTNDREHIGIQLNQPLIIGQKYFLSFYTVMIEEILSGYHFGMPSNGIGLRLSTVAYSVNNPCPIDNFAHLYSVGIINDTINWTRISGSFIADSAYNYLIVGNFLDDAHTDTLHYTCDSCLNYLSYYYVDDICLSIDSLLCNGGIDNIPCDVGIHENTLQYEVIIFPNPASEFVKIIFSDVEDAELKLVDLLGNVIIRNQVADKKSVTLNLSSVSQGCYLLQIINKRNGTMFNKKILKL